jgi:hypothetical protein
MAEMIEKSALDLDFAALTRRTFTPSPAAWEDQVLYFLLLDRFSDGQEQGPPERRFPRGAFAVFAGSSRSALSATRYRPLPCEETPRRQLRRHGPCFGGCRETQERAGAMLSKTLAPQKPY